MPCRHALAKKTKIGCVELATKSVQRTRQILPTYFSATHGQASSRFIDVALAVKGQLSRYAERSISPQRWA